MKMLALDLISMMVQPLWDIASLGELASGVPSRPWITFQMLGPSELDIASWRRFFQLSVLALLHDKCLSTAGDFDGSSDGGDFGCRY